MSETHDVAAAVRRDLTTALKARDRVATTALRSLSAALANAEAVAPGTAGPTPIGSDRVAGAVVGVGGTEVDRRHLDADAVDAVVVAEIAERTEAAPTLDAHSAAERAAELRAEVDVLRRYRS